MYWVKVQLLSVRTIKIWKLSHFVLFMKNTFLWKAFWSINLWFETQGITVVELEHMIKNVHLLKFIHPKLQWVFHARGYIWELRTFYLWQLHQQHIEALHEYASRPVCHIHHASRQKRSKWCLLTLLNFTSLLTNNRLKVSLLRLNNARKVCFQVQSYTAWNQD